MEVSIEVAESEGIQVIPESPGLMAAKDIKLMGFERVELFFANFLTQLDQVCHGPGSELYLDVEVVCGDGRVEVAAPLLAAICPTFKVASGGALTASLVSTEGREALPGCSLLVHVPDVAVQDLKTFLGHVFKFGEDLAELEDAPDTMEALARVLDVLGMDCKANYNLAESLLFLDTDWTTQMVQEEVNKTPAEPKAKRPVRRKKKEEPEEPYFKTEVVETHRSSANYSLRQTIRRKKFTDEISDASDSDDDHDISSEGESDYEPNMHEEDNLQREEAADEAAASASEEETSDLGLEGKAWPVDEGEDELEPFNVRVTEGDHVEVDDDVDVEEEDEECELPREEVPHPRSLLKPNPIPARAVFTCSGCDGQTFATLLDLKRHSAQSHEGSKFFVLPEKNPHSICIECSIMMKTYEKMFASSDVITLRDICFPCPHCHRRFMGDLSGLANHLATDHRNGVSILSDASLDLTGLISVMRVDDPEALTCEFCSEVHDSADTFNQHLFTCPNNFCTQSPGLFCHICGKMFSNSASHKDHLHRHGSEKLQRAREFPCASCPVACTTEAHLERHMEREHAGTELDADFVLHENCQRCEALMSSYLENKLTQTIATDDVAFKCPHCLTILYAHQKHAPRYLRNHVTKFHWDEGQNELALGGRSSSDFVVLNKNDPQLLTCAFCDTSSNSRGEHNEHLALCPSNDVPSKPGYMCDTCGFIGGTARLLREHLSVHVKETASKPEKVLKVMGRDSKRKAAKSSTPPGRKGRPKKYAKIAEARPSETRPKKKKTKAKKAGQLMAKVDCDHCALKFKRAEDMMAHAVIHQGKITCPIHNVMFKLESEVYLHVNMAQPEDKHSRLVCCVCQDEFKHMCIFMKHLRRHLGISPYVCHLCEKSFRVYATLESHVDRQHGLGTGDRSGRLYHCMQCSKSFITKGHLLEHISGIHDKSEVFYCPVCSKTFMTKKRVQKHIYAAHKEVKDQYTTHKKLEVFEVT